MPFFSENAKMALQNFFIFGTIKDFCNTAQCVKSEHRSPDKIMRYSALYFSKNGIF